MRVHLREGSARLIVGLFAGARVCVRVDQLRVCKVRTHCVKVHSATNRTLAHGLLISWFNTASLA